MSIDRVRASGRHPHDRECASARAGQYAESGAQGAVDGGAVTTTVLLAPSRSMRAHLGAQRPCRPLQVRSIDTAFKRALQANVFEARVHSVFEHVINLDRCTGDLFTLAARGMDNAPCTAIVDIDNFAGAGIAVDEPVVAIESVLHVGERLVLDLESASIWQARLPRYTTTPRRMSDQLRAARSYLAQHEVRGGMSVQGGVEGAFALEVATALENRSTSLLDALAEQRHADACRYAVSMLGLGPGLTPSGDDFLVGLFAVLNVAGSPCHGLLDGGTAVLKHATGATNAISLAALTAAADGRVRESIAALINTLMHGTTTTLDEPLWRVLAIGATSGADLVAGIAAGLELNLQFKATRSVESPL
jgi:hypothetical protein